jgi:CubicO group peptidase (beta-lactamase class C family)
MSPRAWLPALLTCLLLPLCAAPLSAQTHESAAELKSFVDSGVLAGAVTLVANKDVTLDVDAVGWADIAAKSPMQPDSVFWIASMSKPITAAAVMMLVDEGKISLNDPVEKYLPEFKGLWLAAEKDDQHILLKHPARLITVRDVLSHVSGMPFKSALETPYLDGLPLPEAVRSYAMIPLDFEPGGKYQYSNAGINTAARILEVVSGMPYEKFMDERLLEPLGMKDTAFWPNKEQVKRLAKSYRPNKEKTGLEEFPISQLKYPLEQREGRYPMPAGGLFSTAADVALFCRMILNDGQLNGHKYLSPEAVAQLTSRQTPEGLKESYGLGFSVAGTSFGHGGAHATNMNIDKARGLVTVYLVQHGGFPGNGKDAIGVFRKTAETRYAK